MGHKTLPCTTPASGLQPDARHEGTKTCWRRSNEEWEEVWVVGYLEGRVRVRKVGMPESEVVCDKQELFPRNQAELEAIDDLTGLPFLDEPNMLQSLQSRFVSKQIYTWTGRILIALNPWSTELKDSGFYSHSAHIQFSNAANNAPPHVFAIANNALRSMLSNQASQTILVSGESGSGKTETTKYLMSHISALSDCGASSSSSSSSRGFSIERRILESNPLLEAFGNAKTLRNDNSRSSATTTADASACSRASAPC